MNEIAILEQQIEKYTIDLMVVHEQHLHVDNQCTAEQALSMALQSRKILKSIEDSRKEIVRPHIDFQKALKKLVDDVELKLKSIEENLQEKLEKWMIKQKENPFTTLDKIVVEDGSITQKEEWDWRLDGTQVDENYLITQVDDAAVDKAVKSGIRKISGVEIFKKTKTEMRIKN